MKATGWFKIWDGDDDKVSCLVDCCAFCATISQELRILKKISKSVITHLTIWKNVLSYEYSVKNTGVVWKLKKVAQIDVFIWTMIIHWLNLAMCQSGYIDGSM